MINILQHAEVITRYRDHALVDLALLSSLIDLLGPHRKALQVRLYRIVESEDRAHVALTAWNNGSHIEYAAGEHLVLPDGNLLRAITIQAITQGVQIDPLLGRLHTTWLPIVHEQSVLACVEIGVSRALGTHQLTLIQGMAGLFRNYLSLLHFSEIDTLTRLLNRKTFDHRLQKLLADGSFSTQVGTANERRLEAVAEDNWLAVIDIDHFKSINDRFGHLFGDEVLILFADLMRRTFRHWDKLFRFGGEEFVIILRNATKANALGALERFRQTVAQQTFPQAGNITISIGLTRINLNDSPTTLVGRADQALYHAKKHGRNQLCQYETLAAEGKLMRQVVHQEAEFF